MKTKIDLDSGPVYTFDTIFGKEIDVPEEKLKECKAALELYAETFDDINEFLSENYPDLNFGTRYEL
jgi:hypothetical protein